MSDDPTFLSFMRKVRAGDQQAAEELVARYRDVIKAAVRRRLNNQALRQRFDESDICQSVLRSFFIRSADGQYDLDDPKQLAGLLAAMAQNKFRQQARFQYRNRRDVRVSVSEDPERPLEVEGREANPERQAISRELLTRLLEKLSSEERAIAELRASGKSWDEVALELGGTPQARRKQLSRALERVGPSVGLDKRSLNE